jgi:hypothetical protein
LGTTGADRTGTFTVTIPNASQPVSQYEVCWAAPYDFVKDGGTMTTSADYQGFKPGTTLPLRVGTLPDCARRNPVVPCVSDRSFQSSTSTAVISVLTDGRDPWRY